MENPEASRIGTDLMTIETRVIEEQDRREILAVAEALPEWFDSDARGRAIPTDLWHQHGFVALSEGEIVGFITLFFAEGRLNIGWIGVRPDHQTRRIGSRLLACAEEYGRQHGMAEIATYTLGDGVEYEPYEATRQFYFKRGFTIYQRSTTIRDIRFLHQLPVLVKPRTTSSVVYQRRPFCQRPVRDSTLRLS